MSCTTTIPIQLSSTLSDFVAASASETGSHENVSVYTRDLIRRDKEQVEQETVAQLKAELTRAFAAREESYQAFTAAEIIARNKV
jgi:hypothetical protein